MLFEQVSKSCDTNAMSENKKLAGLTGKVVPAANATCGTSIAVIADKPIKTRFRGNLKRPSAGPDSAIWIYLA